MKPKPTREPEPKRVRLRIRARPEAGGRRRPGQWVMWTFATENERLFFVTLWEHDFEMVVPARER